MRITKVLICLILFANVYAQNDSVKHAPKFTLKGYVKYLEQVSFANNASNLLTNNEIHNRLNFRYQPNKHFNFRLEVRNRIYYGDIVKSYPDYAALVTNYNATINLSKNWINQNSVLFNTTIDRASMEYIGGKWDITIGRQRINWGINTVWAPNDIFNTFNYFDFDYEERPGSDAVRVQYNINNSSSIEVAARPDKVINKNIGAVMYRFNKWSYDFQAFSGIFQQDFTAGAGWAGNLKDAGFKGEVSYFTPYHHLGDSNALTASLSVDYGFKNGLYVLVSGLYNGLGKDSAINVTKLSTELLSAKNIFPFKITTFSQVSYSFTPILKASLGLMYSPAGNSVILLPTLTYSIADNWVLDFIGQSFFSQQNGGYTTLGNSFYLRIKFGF